MSSVPNFTRREEGSSISFKTTHKDAGTRMLSQNLHVRKASDILDRRKVSDVITLGDPLPLPYTVKSETVDEKNIGGEPLPNTSRFRQLRRRNELLALQSKKSNESKRQEKGPHMPLTERREKLLEMRQRLAQIKPLGKNTQQSPKDDEIAKDDGGIEDEKLIIDKEPVEKSIPQSPTREPISKASMKKPAFQQIRVTKRASPKSEKKRLDPKTPVLDKKPTISVVPLDTAPTQKSASPPRLASPPTPDLERLDEVFKKTVEEIEQLSTTETEHPKSSRLTAQGVFDLSVIIILFCWWSFLVSD
ncbi:unnamed protein product [Kuraishia capsulata CBS 1993]|uniref:Uncharacterized protein n=1 Tax=Kuraishia capsulata CBS 1993 TaxID=1382522 RepID=W6MX93_9ASCO|nr:uncharacterized protein KUCA_T00004473001 [Kuraishia capsulata CBS 1993]CDK28490.1 unnamed protein product [Kuraishia capsulata CBS 1993]